MSEDVVIHREMGCTRNEFLGWLPGALRGAAFDIEGDLIRSAFAGGEVQIRIAPAPDRKLGGLALPVLQVWMHFVGIEASAREEFIKHFDLFTGRGGG